MTAKTPTSRQQAALIDWLASPGVLGDAAPERIDTHISHVFLTATRAYKLKRALKYPFLDYSTPELRQRYAEAEVAMNRRTAPDLYLGVKPVYRANGGFSLTAGSDPVDWLVEMRRFDQGRMFSALAARGELEPAAVARLADAAAAFHREAEPRPDQGGYAGMVLAYDVALMAWSNAADEAELAEIDGFRRRLERLVLAGRRRLEARRRHGFVRYCHGDLHLANVVLEGGRALPFDGIEFSDAIACIDVLYDIAYAVMDLLYFGRRDLAALLLNRYLEATHDYGGVDLLPMFLGLRAVIRAMTNRTSGRPEGHEHARRYADLAKQLLDLNPMPRLVAIGGFSGTGKSSLARRLALEIIGGPGAIIVRSDGIRKRLAGVKPEETLPDSAYRADWHARTYQALMRDARRILARGWPVIVDATFTHADARARLERMTGDLGISFIGLWLEAPYDVLAERIRARGPSASDADIAVLDKQWRAGASVAPWARVDVSGDRDECLENALGALMAA
ncbi:MAG: AAA family ATPase [Sphingomonadales bacterium]|nr:AAA family ATPase [Sphingomonadales bacterium]